MPDGFFGKNMVGQEQWARRGESDAPIAANTIPVGVINAYYGTTAPAGWLLCNGGSFSAATYPQLADLLGGTTLPNLKGKVVVGIDGAQTEFDTLGETGGVKTLTSTQMPSHVHGLNGHDHASATGDRSPAHTHGATQIFGTSDSAHVHYIGGPAGEGSTAPQNTGGGSGRAVSNWSPAVSADSGHTHSVSGDSGNTTSTGSGGAGGNLQPYMALNYIIKAA